jgi:hypothetical protein
MKKLGMLVIICILTGCQEKSQKQDGSQDPSMAAPEQENKRNPYPSDFAKVLEAHGGIDHWKKEKTLKFTIGDSEDSQQYIVDLTYRRDKIITLNYEMGYDGKEAWVVNKKEEYKGNAAFMHNLMFYFYAMPFILADEGLNYSSVEDKRILGKTYKGIQVTFDTGVGASSGDEYILYYDRETHNMEWLAYKATFGADTKPEWYNYIHYDQWLNVNGLILPTSIAWHVVENGEVKEEKNRVDFNTISLSQTAQPSSFYAKPANAMSSEIKK